MEQVQRKNTDSLNLTVQNIVDNLNIQDSEKVLDVCCGNGLITNLISENCSSIHGVDLSQELINTAKSKYPKIDFEKASATFLSNVFEKEQFDKIYLQYSFQYFDKPNQGRKVIEEMLKVLKPNGILFIGDIPDRNKLWKYYNTFLKRFFLITSKMKGKNRMGKFWSKEELDSICKKLGVYGTFLIQEVNLPYSHYRFDYLIQK